MTVNNFTQIKSLLDFQSDDDFYHLQIIKRKKEHPDLGSNNIVIKTYYIQSVEYLETKFSEIQSLCDLHDARAYINLNVRSFEKAAFQMLKKTTDIIMNKDFKAARKAFESVCGEIGTSRDKMWVIDIDWVDLIEAKEAREIEDFVQILQYETGREPIHEVIRTKNGFHLITRPFNIQKFKEKFPQIGIHKNNPTILYVP